MHLILGEGKSDYCDFCGAYGGLPHTEECKQNWREMILSYTVEE